MTDGVTLSRKLKDIISSSEVVVVLPYGLSIIDLYSIYKAMMGCPIYELGVQGGRVLKFESVFDFYDFDRNIFDRDVTISINGTSFVHWDGEERFVLVSGEASFCKEAVPYPKDVIKHYFVEGSIFDRKKSSPEDIYNVLSNGKNIDDF